MINNNGLLQAALEYAGMGYGVFPLVPHGSVPITEHGCNDATTSEEQIIEWWTQKPDANIGIATNGLVVVDIDGDTNDWLTDPEIMKSLTGTAASRTPRGGRHFIFKQPSGGDFRNTASKLSPNVDTRANGGYIVAPPSIRADGTYQWLETYELNEPKSRLPDVPGWIIEKLNKESKTRLNIGEEGNPIPDGQRNSTLAQIGGNMRRIGLGESEIAGALLVVNKNRCNPPLSEPEVQKVAASIAKYAPDQVSQALTEGWRSQYIEPKKSLPDTGPMPIELLNVPGFIGDVMKYNLDGAFKPQPELALAAAITLMGTLTGRKITDRFDTRTNVYCLGVCRTGGGKERARQVNKQILHESGADKLIGPEGVASHAGLVSAVDHQNTLLLQLDEIGRMIKTLGNAGKSPHLYHIATVLMKMFTSSNSLYIGDAYADTKKSKVINQPHACLYGTTVPQSLYEGLTSESVTDGFLSRMMVFEASDHSPLTQKGVSSSLPENIKTMAQAWFQYQPGGNLSNENPTPYVVDYTEQAETVFQNLEDEAFKAQGKDEAIASLWTRTIEKARKLALIYACSETIESPRVTGEAADWACTLSRYLTQKMIFIASDWVSESPFDAMAKKILRIIKSSGPEGISKSGLTRKTQSIRPRERNEIIETLVMSGEIRSEDQGTAKKTKTVFFQTDNFTNS